MKFGQVSDPASIDFSFPPTQAATIALLNKHLQKEPMEIYVGGAKWNRLDLKGFFPRGTKDELSYYATQFNSIELNATFYKTPSKSQVEQWKDKTPAGFKFFPKIPMSISHYSRLLNSAQKLEEFIDAVALFEEKLGMCFLQLIDNYKPKDFNRLADFLSLVPKGFPFGVEVRNKEWFEPEIATRFYQLLEELQISNIIVDTPGRRDMMHMRLTTPTAFIRFVGSNHPVDYQRLDEWVQRLKQWQEEGLQQLYFFVHQQMEVDTPLLSAYFIEKLNAALGTDLSIPRKPEPLKKAIKQ